MKTYRIITTDAPLCGFKVQDVATGAQDVRLFTSSTLCAMDHEATVTSKGRELVVFPISLFDPATGELAPTADRPMWVVKGKATPLPL
jgi:hypothetical protein